MLYISLVLMRLRVCQFGRTILDIRKSMLGIASASACCESSECQRQLIYLQVNMDALEVWLRGHQPILCMQIRCRRKRASYRSQKQVLVIFCLVSDCIHFVTDSQNAKAVTNCNSLSTVRCKRWNIGDVDTRLAVQWRSQPDAIQTQSFMSQVGARPRKQKT